jgi:hypothetical protein
MKRIVWHYTYDHIDEILASGVLLPPVMVPTLHDGATPSMRKEKDFIADAKMLLFSSNDVWEPASFRAIALDGIAIPLLRLDQYDHVGMTIHRIGVDISNLKSWTRLKTITRMSAPMARSLEDIAHSLGSNPVSEWWGTTVPVPAAKWEAIESRVNGVWQPMFEEAA